MQKKQGIKTNSTFWSQLQADIDKYSNRARKNIKIYENLVYKRHPDKMKHKSKHSEQLMSNPSITSINTIRSKINEQKSKEKAINNRLKYMKVKKNRKLQSSELVKKKYERVLSIRSETIRQKQFLEHEIQTYKENDLLSQKEKANQVKSQRWKIEQSVSNKTKNASLSAQKIRAQSAKNQRIIYERNLRKIQENKVKAVNVQIQEQQNRKKLEQLERQKVINGKMNKSKKLWDSYKTYQLHHRRNKTLLINFKQEAKHIEQQREKAENNLMIYSELLRLKRKNNISLGNEKEKEIQSFYLAFN